AEVSSGDRRVSHKYKPFFGSIGEHPQCYCPLDIQIIAESAGYIYFLNCIKCETGFAEQCRNAGIDSGFGPEQIFDVDLGKHNFPVPGITPVEDILNLSSPLLILSVLPETNLPLRSRI